MKITHGRAGSPTYKSWLAMRQRCTNPKNGAWIRYGGRGIEVCDRWKSFENFLADMGERPEGMTLDRKDNNGNYEPDNCRWATPQEQCNNRSSNRKVIVCGEKMTATKAAKMAGISVDAFIYRIDVLGMSESSAATSPKGSLKVDKRAAARSSRSAKFYDFHGEQLLLAEVCERIGVPQDTLTHRLKRHPFNLAIEMPYTQKRSQHANQS